MRLVVGEFSAVVRFFVGEFGAGVGDVLEHFRRAVMAFDSHDEPVTGHRTAAAGSGNGIGCKRCFADARCVVFAFLELAVRRTGQAIADVFTAVARIRAHGVEADFTPLRCIASDFVAGRGRDAVDDLAIGDDAIVRVERGFPVARIFPVAVASLGGDVTIGVVGSNPVPEQEQRLVEAFGTVGRETLRTEEARTARKYRDDQVFVGDFVVRSVEDQRTTRVAAGSRAFTSACFVLVKVEVERIGTARIVEVEAIQDLRQVAEGSAEQEGVAHVERGQRADHVLCSTATPVDALGGAGRAGARTAIAGDVDVIAGTIFTRDFFRTGQRREEQRPSGQVGGRRVEAGQRNVALEEAEAVGASYRARMIEDAVHVVHEGIGVAHEPAVDPVDETGKRVGCERPGRAHESVIVIFFRAVVHAVRCEQHCTRVDQRARADEAVVAVEHADTGKLVIGIDRAAVRTIGVVIDIVIGDDGMSRAAQGHGRKCDGCSAGQETTATAIKRRFHYESPSRIGS